MRARPLIAAAAFALTAALAPAATALGGVRTAPAPVTADCDGLGDEWFVNPDETDRAPERKAGGFLFEAADLIHRNAPAGTTVDNLKPGAYAASPAPDQPSFFSVEVATEGATPSGYATLRYDADAAVWTMVTGGQLYTHADPAELVKMTAPAKSSTVVRFGVGYTKNPPGTVATLVSSVTFAGKTYDLTCEPKPSPSASASVSPSPSSGGSPSASTGTSSGSGPAATRTTPAGAAPSLPVTGPGIGTILGVGAGLLIIGVCAVLVIARRRATTFEA